MWAHCILLLSPDRKSHLGLIITSEQRYHSAISALKASSFPRNYQDWYILGFASSFKPDVHSPAEMVRAQIPGPGSIVSISV